MSINNNLQQHLTTWFHRKSQSIVYSSKTGATINVYTETKTFYRNMINLMSIVLKLHCNGIFPNIRGVTSLQVQVVVQLSLALKRSHFVLFGSWKILGPTEKMLNWSQSKIENQERIVDSDNPKQYRWQWGSKSDLFYRGPLQHCIQASY